MRFRTDSLWFPIGANTNLVAKFFMNPPYLDDGVISYSKSTGAKFGKGGIGSTSVGELIVFV